MSRSVIDNISRVQITELNRNPAAICDTVDIIEKIQIKFSNKINQFKRMNDKNE